MMIVVVVVVNGNSLTHTRIHFPLFGFGVWLGMNSVARRQPKIDIVMKEAAVQCWDSMKIKLRSRARGAHKRLSCTAQQYKMFQNQSGTCHTLCFHFKLQTLDAHTHTKYEPSKEEEEYSLPFDLAAAWCECMKERTIFLMMIRHDNVCCFDDSSSGMSVLRVVCVCYVRNVYLLFSFSQRWRSFSLAAHFSKCSEHSKHLFSSTERETDSFAERKNEWETSRRLKCINRRCNCDCGTATESASSFQCNV